MFSLRIGYDQNKAVIKVKWINLCVLPSGGIYISIVWISWKCGCWWQSRNQNAVILLCGFITQVTDALTEVQVIWITAQKRIKNKRDGKHVTLALQVCCMWFKWQINPKLLQILAWLNGCLLQSLHGKLSVYHGVFCSSFLQISLCINNYFDLRVV